ncbi:MAG: hypothetical protein FD180_5089 [Planctomycetota bacterium]|nr:MAG: hypothetical protein FD180_5089 [Planctomycetota bacterium]
MRRIACAVLALSFGASAGRAESPIPAGFVKVETNGPVQIHMANAKWTSKTEFMIKFNDLQKSLNEFWNADVKSLEPGGANSRFEARGVPKIDLVLFDNEAERDDFFMKAGTPDFSRPGPPPDTVYLALIDGKVTKPGLEILARMLSRVYAWHGLYFGPPAWLDRGMAEYFAFANKGVKPGESDEYLAMVERLHEVQTRGAEKPLAETMASTGENWSKEDNDNAWCLCHLLMTECKSLSTELWLILSAQQGSAIDRREGVINDSRRLVKYQLERAFGSAEALQSGWDWHRDQLVKGGAIARLKKAPGSVRDAAGFLTIGFTAVVKSANSTSLETSGWFAYSGPWPGPITVLAAISEKGKDFGGDVEISGDRSDKQGTPAKWKEKRIPVPVSWWTAQMRVTVRWEVDGGGVYQASSVKPVSIPNR